ncbi:MAG: hypothetical protein PCFJNLEI_02567 [Verrucomicrobiae bacterium]|nr:hypothetical protein [Verrucomicrobiae bacterium]
MRLACGFSALLLLVDGVRADVLIGTNDERFVGQVIEESENSVIFESDLGGRLTIPRPRVREIQRHSPSPVSVWKPPGLGHDGYDWMQLKSGEWLRGWLQYVQNKKVGFDSDELEELTLKLKNVRSLYTVKPMYAKFDNHEPVHGLITLSNEVVYVDEVGRARADLIGITPSGQAGLPHWTGRFVAGLNLRAGNTESADLNVRGELARRTPNTLFNLKYIGNFAEVNGTEDENDQRVNAVFDVRLDRHWFVRPLQGEIFFDPLANIAYRATVGLGGGYYFIDQDDRIWWIATGPGFQSTRFDNVEPGESGHASTPGGLLESYFKTDLTKRVDLILSYQGFAMSKAAGLYTHHALLELQFEIKRHLDLDVALVWDYLHYPQPEADGSTPKRGDLRLTLGLDVWF